MEPSVSTETQSNRLFKVYCVLIYLNYSVKEVEINRILVKYSIYLKLTITLI